jgi:hypothetical protein
MEKITFFWEWLMLPKEEFNILLMLADRGGSFSGNLSDMCRYFRVDHRNSKNKVSIKNAIENLTLDGFILSQRSGYTYKLQIIPKDEKVELLRKWVDPILQADHFSESVAKAPVIKALIWISQNSYSKVVTNDQIVPDLNISVSTFGSAKNVLEKDFHVIMRELEQVTLANGEKRNIGQRLGVPADWSE